MAGVAGDITGALRFVLELAKYIQEQGNNWYLASDALEKFKLDVQALGVRHKYWQVLAQKYGLSQEAVLHDSLVEAQGQLEKEKGRVDKLKQSRGGEYFFKLRKAAFPARLGQSIEKLDKGLDDIILSKWSADEGVEAAAIKMAKKLARSPALDFSRDSRYVKIETIEKEVRHALENQGVRTVLLHGSLGTGKSSMARHLALDYEEARMSTTSTRFDQILFVKCGSEAEVEAKQKEVLNLLTGWEENSDPGEQTGRYLNGLLKQLLKERRVLFIFDDVRNVRILDTIVASCGERVRVLVTSRNSRLCEDSTMTKVCISMDRITGENARQILQVHAGFGVDDHIPEPVKARMDILVAKGESNPYAMALIAAGAIDGRRPQDMARWDSAVDDFKTLLLNPHHNIKTIHGVQYKSSLDEARLSTRLNGVGEDANDLLALMTMLKGPTSPEEVIQLIYNTAICSDLAYQRMRDAGQRSSTEFFNAKRNLEDSEFIQVSEFDGGFYWSISILDKLFLIDQTRGRMQDIDRKISYLVYSGRGVDQNQAHVVQLLKTLFFQDEWKKTIPAGVRISPSIRCNDTKIFRLMLKNAGEDWSKDCQAATDQVLVSYIQDYGEINQGALEVMLSSPYARKVADDPLFAISSDVLLVRAFQGLGRSLFGWKEKVITNLY